MPTGGWAETLAAAPKGESFAGRPWIGCAAGLRECTCFRSDSPAELDGSIDWVLIREEAVLERVLIGVEIECWCWERARVCCCWAGKTQDRVFCPRINRERSTLRCTSCVRKGCQPAGPLRLSAGRSCTSHRIASGSSSPCAFGSFFTRFTSCKPSRRPTMCLLPARTGRCCSTQKLKDRCSSGTMRVQWNAVLILQGRGKPCDAGFK